MILFPQDDLKSWCGAYPPEAVQGQFTRLADLWRAGADRFRAAMEDVSPNKRSQAEADLAIVDTCYRHFRSTAIQVEFYRLRGQLDGSDRRATLQRMHDLAAADMVLAREQYRTARRNSLIAYEASNHYYYTPLDLAEKVLNCVQVMEEIGLVLGTAGDHKI